MGFLGKKREKGFPHILTVHDFDFFLKSQLGRNLNSVDASVSVSSRETSLRNDRAMQMHSPKSQIPSRVRVVESIFVISSKSIETVILALAWTLAALFVVFNQMM